MYNFKTEFKCFFGEDFKYVGIKHEDISDKIFEADKDLVDSIVYKVLENIYDDYNSEINLDTIISHHIDDLTLPAGISFRQSDHIRDNLILGVKKRISEYAFCMNESEDLRDNMIINILKCSDNYKSQYSIFITANCILSIIKSNFRFNEYEEVAGIMFELYDNPQLKIKSIYMVHHTDLNSAGDKGAELLIGYNIEQEI